jgi:CRISPR-associated protein Cas2
VWVIDTEAAPPRLRGLLARWTVEVRAGLYVGVSNTKVRDLVWKEVEKEGRLVGSAVLLYESPSSPSGFVVKTSGANRRVPIDIDGVVLMAFLAPEQAEEPFVEPEERDPDYLNFP